MSVYTQLSEQEFNHLLSRYDLGNVQRAQGIAAGIENTNYKLTLKKEDACRSYFLTIFEQLTESELDFFIPFLHHLDEKGCKVAGPKNQINGEFIHLIQNKPAAIFDCLEGGHIESTTQDNCRKIATELAKIHVASALFNQQHDNQRGFYWLQKQIQSKNLTDKESEQTYLETCLQGTQENWKNWQNMDLPKGFIHGDLFPDNCLFKGPDLSGVIDFYAGGSDFWVYDLAILIMAWAQEKNEINTDLKAALVDGYQQIRTLTADEIQSLDEFIKLATLRFWVSRLIAQQDQKGAAITTEKDPDEMKNLLQSL